MKTTLHRVWAVVGSLVAGAAFNGLAQPGIAPGLGQTAGVADNPVAWSLDRQALAHNPHVVQIRPSAAEAPGQSRAGMLSSQYGTISLNCGLNEIVAYAYDFRPALLGRVRLPAGAPQGRYDFLDTLPQGGRQAMQELLKQQFGLTAKRETRQADALLLRVRNSNAPGLKPSAGAGAAGDLSSLAASWGAAHQSRATARQTTLQGTGATIESLAAQFEGRLGQPVIDQTGLTGRYDYTLALGPAPSPVEIKQAVLEQLGLELVAAETPQPVELLVVESCR